MVSKKILIVDDDPDVTLGMHLRLRANHYQTFFAADAAACLLEAKKYQPDLIILDLGLPAADGFKLIEELRKAPELLHIPFMVVSARDFIANQQRVHETGARAFLQKPVDNAELLAVIRQVLHQPTEIPT